jgi:hypothetical protein
MDTLVAFVVTVLVIGFFMRSYLKGEKRRRRRSRPAKPRKRASFIRAVRGNQVTLSYRKDAFTRIKERNSQRIQECMRKGKLKVIFNSNPVEFKQDSIVLEVSGKPQVIPNDYVWIFAGGEPPTAFLKKIGIRFGAQDLTSTGAREVKAAKEAALVLA